VRRWRNRAQLDQRRHEQRHHHDVSGGRRHAHPEDDAGEHRQEQGERQKVLREADDDRGEVDGRAGDRDHADDDARARASERYRNGISCAVF
jgi:hypothetical protein